MFAQALKLKTHSTLHSVATWRQATSSSLPSNCPGPSMSVFPMFSRATSGQTSSALKQRGRGSSLLHGPSNCATMSQTLHLSRHVTNVLVPASLSRERQMPARHSELTVTELTIAQNSAASVMQPSGLTLPACVDFACSP